MNRMMIHLVSALDLQVKAAEPTSRVWFRSLCFDAQLFLLTPYIALCSIFYVPRILLGNRISLNESLKKALFY
jgi:hypothetical protein